MTPASFVILSSSSSLSPVARGWQSAIVANGGTASFRDMQPFDRLFIRPSVADGLWDKIIDGAFLVGLANLNSIMVKFKTAPSVSRIITNNNFVGADYTVSGASAGLKGNGSNKSLLIGSPLAQTTFDSVGMGIYAAEMETTGRAGYIGSRTSPAAADSPHTNIAMVNANRAGVIGQNYSTPSTFLVSAGSSPASVFDRITRINSTDLRYYRNGSQIAATNTDLATGFSSQPVVLFAQSTNGSTTGDFSAMRALHYCITSGMSAAEELSLSTRVNAVMTAFGANKY